MGHQRIRDRAEGSRSYWRCIIRSIPSTPSIAAVRRWPTSRNAIRDTGRVPNLVLSGHVHDYQRIEQDIAPDGPTPFIISGNGGYHNLHAVHSEPGDKALNTGAVLQYASSKRWGFLTLTIDHQTIPGVGTEVDRNGNVQQGDKFSYSAKPIVLANPKSVPTL